MLDAVHEGWIEEVHALLTAAYPINYVDDDGRSALWWAANGGYQGGREELSDHLGCLRVLILACQREHVGSFLELQDSNGRTALFAAAIEGRVQSLQILLAAGADIFHSDDTGQTAMDWAEQSCHVDVIEVLQRESKTVFTVL